MKNFKNTNIKTFFAILMLVITTFSLACDDGPQCTVCGLNPGETVYDDGTGKFYKVGADGCVHVPRACGAGIKIKPVIG